MKKKLSQGTVYGIRAAIALLLVVFALLVFNILAGSKPVLPNADPDQLRKRINVFIAAPVAVQRQWTGYGTAEAIDSANVPCRVTATVERIPPNTLEGAAVSKGQALVHLDESDFVNQLRSAEQSSAAVTAMIEELDRQEKSLKDRMVVEADDVRLAGTELDRVRDLLENNAANQKGLDEAERAVLQAQRSLLLVEEVLAGIAPRRDQMIAQQAELTSVADTARLNLERCTVRSPIDGVIQYVDIEVGESVTLGQRIARVVNTDRMQTPLSLPANARSHVRVGDVALLTSTAEPGLTWRAEVTRIAPEDDPQTRTFAAYVEVDQAAAGGPRLSPGVFVRGTVLASDTQERIVIPRRSIRTERAMIVSDGVIETRRVSEAFAIDGPVPEMGLPDEEWAVLENGIAAGDTVVLTPTRSLSDGQLVEPVNVVGKLPAEPVAADDAASDQQQAQRGGAR
jgi:RND family efflux transporter MFP subunit